MSTALVPQPQRLIERQSSDRVPNCQKCGKPMELAQETETHWAWGCDACKCAHVFSKPQTRAAAQYRIRMERMAERQAKQRQRNARPKYFLLGGR